MMKSPKNLTQGPAHARPHWRYCPRCASELVTQTTEAVERPRCPRCDFILYEQLKVGAGAIVTDGERILLLQRGHEPWAEHWNLPAGYVEANEAPDAAALREAREETGFEVASDGLFGVFHFNNDPRGAGILIVYRAHLIGGTAAASSEVTQTRWFEREDIPALIAGGGHDAAIAAWLRERDE